MDLFVRRYTPFPISQGLIICSKKIYTALKSDRLYGNYYASGFAYDYLVEFYRLANNKSTAEEYESNQTIITAVNYIDSHIRDEITLEQAK